MSVSEAPPPPTAAWTEINHHDEQQRELALMQRLAETLEAEKPIAEAVTSETEAKEIRSFAFLSQKPAMVVLNCSEDDLHRELTELVALPCVTLSAEIFLDERPGVGEPDEHGIYTPLSEPIEALS